MLEAKARDRGHIFLITAGKFFMIFQHESISDNCISLFFNDNSKVVVSTNNECHFEFKRVSSNVDYVP